MKNYKEFARHIRDEIEYLLKASEGLTREKLESDETLRRAFVRSVEIIGEASKSISDEVKSRYPGVEWKKIAGTRDVLIHRYFEIDYDILWDIVQNKLRPLLEEVKKMLVKD